MLLRYLFAGKILTEPRLHRFEFGHGRAAQSRIASAVFEHQFFDEVWPFQNDAASRRLCRKLPKIVQESGYIPLSEKQLAKLD